MQQLMQLQLVAIGHMNRERWRHVASVSAEIGMLPGKWSLDGFLFDQVRLTAPPRGALPMVLAAFPALTLAGAVRLTWRNRQLRRDLQRTATAGPASASPLLQDASTGLFSRDYLQQPLPRELGHDQGFDLATCLGWL